MLTIWGRRNSYNVQKVLWLADELNLDYRHRLAGGETGGLDAESFLSMNPNGRIPVLEDGDLVVWETDAILRYLSSAYASRAFSPRSAAAQSHVDRWMAWASTSLEPAFFTGVFWGFYRTPVERHDVEAITQALEKCARLYSILDTRCSTFKSPLPQW